MMIDYEQVARSHAVLSSSAVSHLLVEDSTTHVNVRDHAVDIDNRLWDSVANSPPSCFVPLRLTCDI